MRPTLLPVVLLIGCLAACPGPASQSASSLPARPQAEAKRGEAPVTEPAEKDDGDTAKAAPQPRAAAAASAELHLSQWRASIEKIAEKCAMVTPQGCVSTYRFAFQAAERRVHSQPLLLGYCELLNHNDHLLASIVVERIGLVAEYRQVAQVASAPLLSCLTKQLPQARGVRLTRVAHLAAAVALHLGGLDQMLALVDGHTLPAMARAGAYPALWALPAQRWLALLKSTLQRQEHQTAGLMVAEMSQSTGRSARENTSLCQVATPLMTHAHLPLAAAAATLVAERCAQSKSAALVAAAEKMASRRALDLVYLNATAILVGNADDGMRLPRALERRLVAIWRRVLGDRSYSGAVRGTALWQIHEADPGLGATLAQKYQRHQTTMLQTAARRVLQQAYTPKGKAKGEGGKGR